ncbi:hypothetical protein KY092_16940 [Natronomonas gomsonensis]|uniref:DUF7260 family protein n=1 Tax=Natronomonas gomsonensis TaxID=1046043 RepID=UPI0020CA2B28|nr:hypothetical protein [Natronomonas gomsonensis]MCY4732242.1 hypothetical protein [Natronomonas gomsonensis]
MSGIIDPIRAAIDRVDEEVAHVEATSRAFERFDAEVRALDPASLPNGGGGVPATGEVTPAAPTVQQGPATAEAEEVRSLFEETVRPYSVADLEESEPLTATMSEELGEGIAAVLDPSTPGQFTAEVQQSIHSAVEQRQAELRAMERALDIERESLGESLERLEGTCEWLDAADERPLSVLGFEALRERHERLETHRNRCETVATDRQAVLDRTTSEGAKTGLTHRSLVAYLSQERSTTFPELSAAARLDAICTECQRTVRDHLTRRA